MIAFASLGSGSQGNALIVQAGETRVLLDCGFSTRTLTARLARLGAAPDELTAIVVTHEHADHVGGVFALARRHRLTIYLTHGTHAAPSPGPPSLPDCRLFAGPTPFGPTARRARKPSRLVT